MHELVAANEDTDFVKQIRLIETFKGAGFLSAMSLMGEIGDFSAFSKPKQLFAYFGLDPAVKQSGKFEGTKIQIFLNKEHRKLGKKVMDFRFQLALGKRNHFGRRIQSWKNTVRNHIDSFIGTLGRKDHRHQQGKGTGEMKHGTIIFIHL